MMQLRNIPNKNSFNINKYFIYTRSLKIKLKASRFIRIRILRNRKIRESVNFGATYKSSIHALFANYDTTVWKVSI